MLPANAPEIKTSSLNEIDDTLPLTPLSSTEWQDAKEVKACKLCFEPFSTLKRKHHCRICGSVVCANCTSWQKIPKCSRVCSACVKVHQTGGHGKAIGCSPATLSLDLTGKIYAVTGGNAGIGFEVTKQLAKQGAKVIMCSRSQARATAAIASLPSSALIDFVPLDLGDLKSVRACAATIIEKYQRLDALINNAGIMMVPEGKTKDGFERQFGVDHLGPFLLTHLLLPLLKSSAPSRVVNCSSIAHAAMAGSPDGHIDFDDLMFTEKKYNAGTAYQQAKLANLLHAKHLAKMMADEKAAVTCVSHHPGWVATDLASGAMGSAGVWIQKNILKPLSGGNILSPAQGAQSTLHCAIDPSVALHNGEFFSQIGLYTDKKSQNGGFPMKPPNPEANDAAVAERLYQVSLELVGEAPSPTPEA